MWRLVGGVETESRAGWKGWGGGRGLGGGRRRRGGMRRRDEEEGQSEEEVQTYAGVLLPMDMTPDTKTKVPTTAAGSSQAV